MQQFSLYFVLLNSGKWEDNVRKLLILLLIFLSLAARAQEGLAPLTTEPETDSVQLAVERQLMYHQLLNGTPENELFSQPFELPQFDFNETLMNHWNINFNDLSWNPHNFSRFGYGYFGIHPSPFVRNGTVFSAGEYQFSDKFKIGGFSYGANSVFSAPLPKQGLNNNYDFNGASMFMQYKVSKNFKIETRVNVQQGR